MGSLHVQFSAVFCVLAILLFQNVNPVENWNVFSSEKGEFKWAKFCDWEGNNFDEIQDVPIADSCGKICLADLKCTHFSWVDETCFLKEITPPVNETPFQEVDRCGFVVNRVWIFYINKKGRQRIYFHSFCNKRKHKRHQMCAQ